MQSTVATPSLRQPPFRTSLDPLETKSDLRSTGRSRCTETGDTPEIAFRHRGWHPLRSRVYAALKAVDAGRERIDRFRCCGTNAWVLRSRTDAERFKIASDLCHDRFCVPCANLRSRTIAANVRFALTGKPARFLTLTLRDDNDGLEVLVAKIVRCFSRLRARKLWKETTEGGCSFVEIKRSSKADRWNVHIHAIVEGKFIPHAELSKAWKQITGTSFVVDIRAVKNPEHAARYVTKYASKPMDPSVTKHTEHLTTAVKALTGRRLCTTFGTWRSLKLTAEPDDEAWEIVAPLPEILSRAAAGDAFSQAILTLLKGETECETDQLTLTGFT